MLVAVFLLSIAMVAMGIAGAVFGAPILVERGMTMVLAGTVVATGGAVLFGIGVATQRLRRIERELVQARERGPRLAATAAAEPPRPMGEPDGEPAPPRLRPTITIDGEETAFAPAPPVAAERSAVTVVGRYASGGNSYVMYSDGSIDAETPEGPRRFASIEELKSFAAGDGRRA